MILTDRNLFIVLILMAISAVLCIVFRCIEKYKIVGHKKLLPLEDIYNSSAINSGIKFEVFQEVYTELGKILGIDPRFIRVTDKMKSYVDYDSWKLSEGTEKMNEWIQKKINTENVKIKIDTVLDLLILINNSH